MTKNRYLLTCDWGTSSFRLGVYDLDTPSFLGEVRSGEGIAVIHRQWQTRPDAVNTNKVVYFQDYLHQQVVLLAEQTATDIRGATIVISGMASSTIGMVLLPYATLPFSLDGRNAIIRHFEATVSFPYPVLLLSGVQSDNDVMRGEETQIAGIAPWLLQNHKPLPAAVVILPGTHSKHIYTTGYHITGIKTFMTGELYQLMRQYSILKDSVEPANESKPTHDQLNAFKAGVLYAATASILHTLFSVRTNQLFDRYDKPVNAFYLSGLLIGSELKELQDQTDAPVFLCCGNTLYHLYATAIEMLELSDRTTFIPQDIAERAAMAGQKIIYEQYIKQMATHE